MDIFSIHDKQECSPPFTECRTSKPDVGKVSMCVKAVARVFLCNALLTCSAKPESLIPSPQNSFLTSLFGKTRECHDPRNTNFGRSTFFCSTHTLKVVRYTRRGNVATQLNQNYHQQNQPLFPLPNLSSRPVPDRVVPHRTVPPPHLVMPDLSGSLASRYVSGAICITYSDPSKSG